MSFSLVYCLRIEMSGSNQDFYTVLYIDIKIFPKILSLDALHNTPTTF